MFKTTKWFPGFSRICERPSPTTRFVCVLSTVLDVDKEADGAANDDLRSTDCECSPFVSKAMR